MSKALRSELRVAKRMARLGTETAFEVLVKARALEATGRDIVHLEIGEPDFDTPGNIIDAATDALHKGFTHYGPSAGLPELRETIAQYVSKTRGVNAIPEEVVVVPGGKPIIFFSILALVEEGNEVIYPNPGFPIYESMIDYVGAKAVPIQLREELDFRLDVDELSGLINDRTKLIILNSPQNPTGGVLTKQDIDSIAHAIGDRNVMVLSDEIYSRLIFEGEDHSIMSVDGMKERTILLDGFSKTYAMTGWRMGYGVMRTDLAAHISRLMRSEEHTSELQSPYDLVCRLLLEKKKYNKYLHVGKRQEITDDPGVRDFFGRATAAGEADYGALHHPVFQHDDRDGVIPPRHDALL